jgi:chromosome segregation ATPase
MSEVTLQHIQQILSAVQNVNISVQNLEVKFEKRLTALENRMTAMENRMTTMEQSMKSIQRLLFDHIEATGEMELEFRQKFNKIDERFDQIDDHFNTTDEKIEYLQYCVSDHNLKFEIIIKQLNQIHETVRNHDHRLKKLESNHGSP